MSMKATSLIRGTACLTVLGVWAGMSLAQQGVVEKLGEKVDNLGRSVKAEAQDLSDAVRKRFDGVRTEVHRMDTHARVYSRLHWDKELHSSKIEVHMLRGGVVLLRGVVATPEAKRKAVTLAADTIEVKSVIDELSVTLESTKTVVPARPAP
jgi:hypothetical protein